MQPQKTLLTNEPKSPYTQELLDTWATFEADVLAHDITGVFTKSQMDRLFVTFLFGINSYLKVLGKMQSDLESGKEPLEKVLRIAGDFHHDLLKMIEEVQ